MNKGKNQKQLDKEVLENLAKEEIVRFMVSQNGVVIEGIRNDMKIFQDQLNHMNSRFDGLENRFDGLENKVGGLVDEVAFIKNYLIDNLEPRVSYLKIDRKVSIK